MQAVFYDKNTHSSLKEALRYKDNVVILAFQYSIAQSSTLDFIPDAFGEIEHAGESAQVEITGQNLFGGSNFDYESYYWYQGSMTRPPCQNTVAWIVFKEKLNVTSEQVC